MVPWVFTGICISALRKSTSLYFCTWNICFSFRETFLLSFFAVMWFGLFFLNVNAAKKDLFLHMSQEKGNAKSLVCYIAINIYIYS